MTPEEIKELATDTFMEKVFFSTMLPEHDAHLLSSVFMATVFMDSKQIDQIRKDKVVAFYEHLDKAGPRTINGYPIFMSMKTITKGDLVEVQKIVEKLREAVGKV